MENSSEYYMCQIISVLKGELSVDSIKETIPPNFIDSNGNGIFHYLAEYSLSLFYKLNYNNKENELIKPEKYMEILNEYKSQIPLYIEILEGLDYDKLCINKQNQTPLIYSIVQKNYIIALELIKRINILTETEYFTIFKLLINSGDCLREDCIDLISHVISRENEKRKKVINKDILNIEDEINGLTPIVIICKDFSENIYEKFNQILKMRIAEYYEYDKDKKDRYKNEFLIKAREQSENDLNDFMLKVFGPLLNNLISLGADINYVENNCKSLPKSAFMYLMKYPFFEYISTFTKKNKINVNYKDESGQTALMHLINNKEFIDKISPKVYQEAFKFFLLNNEIDIGITNDKGISGFGLSLMKGHYDDALSIYSQLKFMKNRPQFNSEILIHIFNSEQNEKITNFFNYFFINLKYNINSIIDTFIVYFNNVNQRTLFHYLCIYSNDNNNKFYIFEKCYDLINNLEVDIHKKDIYGRNALFYLFIDENEKIKNNDPSKKLKFLLENKSYDNLNDTDIYGNSLIFYAVQSGACQSIQLLYDYKASLNIINNEGNTIYSTAVILGDYNLFKYLYNLTNKDKEKEGKKNNNIFLQKVYYSDQIKSFQKPEKNIARLLIDFYMKMNEPLPDKQIIREELEKMIEQNLESFNNANFYKGNDVKSEFKSNYISLLDKKILSILDNITKEKQVINVEDSNIVINNNKYFNMMKTFTNVLDESKIQNGQEKKSLLGNNLFQYCKFHKYENFCRFMINENYHLISICNDFYSLNFENELNYYINVTLNEKDLINFKNEENVTIFHILAKINNSSFYKIHNIENYNLSNLFDYLGNTPIFYACEKFNINFIEHFTNYSFSSDDNDENKVNYSLFLETKNEISPLKSLYLQLNKKKNEIIKLIIDIVINTKQLYILDILLFLIDNYTSSFNKFFSLSYKENISNEDYIRKIIGLYLYYTQELKGDFNENEFKGISPVFYCKKNFSFLFDILIKEKNIKTNCVDKEGKNLIHLIVEMKEEQLQKLSLNKKDILIKALEAGFDSIIDKKDNKDKLPIDYAYLNKDIEISQILSNEYNKKGLRIPKNNYA